MSEKIRRYPGGRPFTPEMADLFYGRKDDVMELHRLVSLEPLVVLYGKSGLGKSSLINAGLIPKLEEKPQNNCVQFRFRAWAGESSQSPLDNTHEYLSDLKLDKTILNKILPDDNSLWNLVKSYHAGNPGDRLVMIFDQFEELFSYPATQIQEFKAELAELLRKQIPKRYESILDVGASMEEDWLSLDEEDFLYDPLNIRILFIIRSDKLHLLDQLSDYLPNILKNNYELKALSESGARAAIIEPAGLQGDQFISPVFAYDKEAENKIMSFLKDEESGLVEAIQLQILCTSFEDNVIEKGWTLLDEDKTGDLNSIIENYYNNKLNTIEDPSIKGIASKLMEDGLVDASREQRLTLHESQIEDLFGVKQELLDQLVDIHLLRRELDHGGGFNYELSHDTLVAPVLSAREVRQQIEAEEELKRQQELLAKERKRRRRAIWFSVIAGFLAIASGITTFLAVRAENRAFVATTEANKAREESDSLLQVTEAALDRAEIQTKLATDAKEKTDSTLVELEVAQSAMEQELLKSRRLEGNLVAGQTEEDAYSYLMEEGDRLFNELKFQDALTYWSNAQFFNSNRKVKENIEMTKLAISIEERFQNGTFNIQESEYEQLKGMASRQEIDDYVKGMKKDIELSIEIVEDALKNYDPENQILNMKSSLDIFRFSIPLNKLDQSVNKVNISILNVNTLNLENLPRDIEGLTIRSDKKLETLKIGFGGLELLKELNLGGLNINELPAEIGELENLESLNIILLPELELLPSSLGELKQLKELELRALYKLKKLPEEIINLENLEILNLSDLDEIESLPFWFENFKKLKELHLTGIPLKSIPPYHIEEIEGLEKLSLVELKFLEDFPYLEELTNLKELSLGYFPRASSNWDEVHEEVGELTNLEKLTFSRLNELNSFPYWISELKNLKELEFNSIRINEFPDMIGDLESLQKLTFSFGDLFRTLPNSISNLKQLKELNLEYLSNLTDLPEEIGDLKGLKKLSLKRLLQLEKLPISLRKLEGLKELELYALDNIRILPNELGEIEGLEKLRIDYLKNIESIPTTIGSLNSLKELDLSYLEKIELLPQELGNLENLEVLSIRGLFDLKSLPTTIGDLKSLKELNLIALSDLEKLPMEISDLKGLEKLELDNLRLEFLPSWIGGLKKLKELNLSDLEIEEFPVEIGDLINLKKLRITKCPNMKQSKEALQELLPNTKIIMY